MQSERNTYDAESGYRKKKPGSRSGVGLRVRSNSNHLKNLDPRESAVSNALNNPNEAFDYFYKIIVIGDEGVGKTNFLLRVAKNYYDPSPK